VRLAWPIAVSTLSYSVMTLVDTLFVGRLGASALAGVGLGGVASFTVLCFGFGLLRGVKVLVSQARGAGDADRVGRVLWTGLAAALALGGVMLLAGQAVALHIARLAASPEAGANAAAYVSVRLLGAPLVMVYVALREHRYGLGDTRSAMVAAVAANVANVGLDWLFLVHLERGVEGAAWATVIGHLLEAAILIGVQWRDDGLRPRSFALSDLRALLAVGVPTGLQFWLEVGSFAILTAIVSGLGDHQVAAHQIAIQVIHFSFLPAMALGEAASVLAGQAVGAGAVRLVRRVARLALVAAVSYTGLCTLVLVLGGSLIVTGFTDDLALRAVTLDLLWVAALFQIADGAAVVARGVLRGAADVRFPAVVGIASAWLFTPPLAYLLGRVAGLGAMGGWIGLSLEITGGAALLWWRLERGGWLGSARRSRSRIRADRADRAEPVLAPA
jgi:MATE family multidrug resistance protein